MASVFRNFLPAALFTTVTLSGATITFPGSVELNQGRLEFGDQDYNGNHTTAIYSASCSGSTCTVTAITNLTDNCTPDNYDDTVQWAEYSKKPNLQSKGKVTEVAGGASIARAASSGTSPAAAIPRTT